MDEKKELKEEKKGVVQEKNNAVQQKKDSAGDKTQAKAQPKKDSDRLENIVALTVFALIMISIGAVFTHGYGLFNKKITPGDRFEVQVGNDPVRGNYTKGDVVMIVFSDYECPFCKKAELTVRELMKNYDGKMILVFKDFPLTMLHPNAYNAALASRCAKEQGKYWEYHDYLFDHNDKLDPQYLKEYARFFNMSGDQFDRCFDSEKYRNEIENDKQQGMQVGVSGTPAFFINGLKVVGAQPIEEFSKIIDSELKNPLQ
jgi:protein-disulfide isomerase